MAYGKSATALRKLAQQAADSCRSWKILRGDSVYINAGKDKGMTGVVKEVKRNLNSVIVEGRNLARRFMPKQGENAAQVITIERPIHVSNVQLIDPETNRPCKAGFQFLEDGTKVRVSRGLGASGAIIPRPAILLQRHIKVKPFQKAPPSQGDGPKDTASSEVMRDTRNS